MVHAIFARHCRNNEALCSTCKRKREKLPRKNCKNGVRFALYSVGWLLLLSSGNSHDLLLKKWYISVTLPNN